MYRIHFNPKTGKFVIQVQAFSMLWVDAKGMSFATYDEAASHVEEVGLNKLYEDRSEDKRRSFMRTAQVQYATR